MCIIHSSIRLRPQPALLIGAQNSPAKDRCLTDVVDEPTRVISRKAWNPAWKAASSISWHMFYDSSLHQPFGKIVSIRGFGLFRNSPSSFYPSHQNFKVDECCAHRLVEENIKLSTRPRLVTVMEQKSYPHVHSRTLLFAATEKL